MPLGRDKCLIERERVLDILDELRVNLPGEIKAARDVVEKRNELLAEGKREAESIRKQAEEKAAQLLNNNELVAQARQKSTEILNNAETKSRELKLAASNYCDGGNRYGNAERTARGAPAIQGGHAEQRRQRKIIRFYSFLKKCG